MTKNDKKTTTGKKLQGSVISLSGTNTIKVSVETKKPHKLYGKVMKSHKNYLVHSEDENVKVGDVVQIEECKPVSKTKSFKLVNVVN